LPGFAKLKPEWGCRSDARISDALQVTMHQQS
jgi:hypothetical protein